MGAINQIKQQLLNYPRKSVLILFLSLVAAVLQAIGITTLVPLFEIINNGEIESLERYKFISYLLDVFKIDLTIISILILFLIFALM